MSEFKYVGSELELFAGVHNWKSYWSSQVRPFIASDIVEVGAGIGTNTPYLDQGGNRLWVCVEPDSLLAAQSTSNLEQTNPNRGYEIVCGTLESLAASQFDTIFYIDVLEHIENDRKDLEIAASRLRVGGRIIVVSPAHQWLFTPFDTAIGHFRRYNRPMLRSISPEGLRIEQLIYLDSAGLALSAAIRLSCGSVCRPKHNFMFGINMSPRLAGSRQVPFQFSWQIDRGNLAAGESVKAMRKTLSRLANTELGAKKANIILALILLAVGFCSAVSAYEKPLWFDEICTVILCRLPSASQIWKALDHAADSNPPVFYLVARMGRQLIPDDHLGYRLPSILGLLATVLCIYAILSRRVDRLSALAGAAFVLCTPLAPYAFEARPYALMVGCVSVAMLAWQRIDDSKLYSFALAITLATALSLHYYTILVWPAFVLAEASVWVFSHRLRASAWAAIVLGAAPLLIFGHLLLQLRRYYGQNFWARPGFRLMFESSSYFLNVLGYWGLSFTIGAIVILVYLSFKKAPTLGSSERLRDLALPIEECALTIGFLLLPMIAVAMAKVTHGGMTYRYMLPTVLGGALAVGYLTSKAAQPLSALLLALILVNYGFSSIHVLNKVVKGSLLEDRAAAAREFKEIRAGYHESDLPIVISSGHQYFRLIYYTPPDQNVGLYALADPPAAVTFAKTDTGDLTILALRKYFPLQVEDYRNFASKHREFLLVSDGTEPMDWWPTRLSHDGDALSLVSADGNSRVYKVSLRPQAP